MPKLSIIVPVYNVEPYIRNCVESIFNQGLDENDYEVIIVNDGSTDKSMEMITDIISQHNNVTVINQENQGLSIARNNGISIARGKYLLMPDSDDMLIENSVKPCLDKALETQADMIVANFLKMNDDNFGNPIISPNQNNYSFVETTGSELLEESLCRFYWRNLYRKDFLTDNHIKFVPHILAQDVPFTNECFLRAKKCLRTPWIIYIYRTGHTSASSYFTFKRAKDTCIATAKIWEFTKIDNLPYSVRLKQKDIVFHAFYTLISAISFGHLNKKEMIQTIKVLKQEAPDMSFHHGFKQKVWSYMYQKHPNTLIISFFYFQKFKNKLRHLSLI